MIKQSEMQVLKQMEHSFEQLYHYYWKNRAACQFAAQTDQHTYRQYLLFQQLCLLNAKDSPHFVYMQSDSHYQRINRHILSEWSRFLAGLFRQGARWPTIVLYFVLFHDYQKTNCPYQKSFHEEESARYFDREIAPQLDLPARDIKIISFLIRMHILLGIPVLGELSSRSMMRYFEQLTLFDGEDQPIIAALSVIQAYLDGASSGQGNGFVLPSELPFYYWIWLNIPRLTGPLLADGPKRLFFPSLQQLAQWAEAGQLTTQLPRANEKTECQYRLAKLSKGKLKSEELGMSLSQLIGILDDDYAEIRQFKGILTEMQVNDTIWKDAFLKITAICQKFKLEQKKELAKVIIVNEKASLLQYDAKHSALIIDINQIITGEK